MTLMEPAMQQRPILLVEDNPNDEMFALRAFGKHQIQNQVVVARDGQEALDWLLDATHELPAFVLLDLKLPKIGGLEVLQRLRRDARTRLVPVIILTSSTHGADLRESYGLGANSYVCKSLDIDRFTLEIGALAHYWLNVNTAPPELPAGVS